ncbi:polysaccharide deacetylase family protein [Sporosarcina aquimarina]|uniref:Polysaccharide deacetylase family protein n=1 Tax=Sporosarcina aquimarina TaxID=114975 RepID=A0ABU4G244_9BACL|nr:polysaccharide deacetylase family protein [Sporosarcina aquimarina]MDW0110393.1 polysaccharide deacetylase family protein [Sporosarcina aquimarina]
MKKRFANGKFKLIDVLLTTIIVFLGLTAILLIFSKGSSETELKSASSSPKKDDGVVVDKSDSKYKGIKIVTETSNNPLGKYAIQYPQSNNEAFNDRVSSYINKAKKNYLTAIRKLKVEDNKKKSELNISFETYVDKKGNYSFVLLNNERMQEKKRLSEIESFHLNSTNGEQLSIQTVFKSDEGILEKVTERVRNKIHRTEKLRNGIVTHNMQIRTEPKWENFENFAITKDSMYFYFESGSLKEEEAGPQIVKISIGKMNDLLKPEFQVTINSSDSNEKIGKPDGSEADENNSEKGKVEDSKDDSSNEDSSQKKEENKGTAAESENSQKEEQPGEKLVALTFDDGPDPKSTIQILEILKKYDAKATFFMLGSRVEYYPDAAKAVKSEGHEIGNHSWNHPDLSKMPLANALEEINRTRDIIQKVTGEKPTVFRPPYGAFTNQLSKQTIPPIVLWNVDTLDWKYRSAPKLLEEVKKSTHDGSTVLMHDIHQSTADGLEDVMAYLQSQGYKFVTVSELN